jgi:PPOX class probable F420-dependent enzyme
MSLKIGSVITAGKKNAFQVDERKKNATLADIPESHRPLLDGPIVASLATITPKGRAQLSPVWCDHDGTHINLNSAKGRVKDKNMRERPEVALLLLNPEDPYHWMSINGRIVDVIDEDDPERGHLATQNIDDLADLYVDRRPYPFRDPDGEVRVLYKIEPTRILTFGPTD